MKQTPTSMALMAALAGWLTAGDFYTKDGKHDFLGLSRYPEGGKLVEGVELYEVKEAGGAPQEYKRRVVRWWPRKGVDFVEVQDGMVEREWTRAPDLLEAATKLEGDPVIEELAKVDFGPMARDCASFPAARGIAFFRRSCRRIGNRSTIGPRRSRRESGLRTRRAGCS